MALNQYTREDLFEMFIQSIERGKPHEHYQRTVSLSNFYRQIMTGENQDDLIVSYKERETEEQKRQRIKITLSRTKHIANKVYNQFDEIRRVDNIIDNIKFEDAAKEEAKRRLNDALSEFYKDEHLSQYLFERIRYLTFYDPNAYLIIEYREAVNEQGATVNRAYPIEVYSEQVYDVNYFLGNLQYLISKVPRTPKMRVGEKPKEKQVFRYVMYAQDTAIEALQVDPNEDTSMLMDYEPYVLQIGERKEEKIFYIKQMDTQSGMNPAISVGYIPDAQTNGTTYVSPIDPAEHLFRKLINRNSELELHRALHGFYQKFVIADECDYKNISTGEVCMSGTVGETDCPKCKGSGFVTHKSVQDVMYILKPRSKEEHIPLSEYVHYVQIPQYITDAIKTEVDDLERQIGEAIFSNEVFDKTEVAATATEARLNMRGLYNALSSYSDNWSRIYKHCVWQTAFYLDVNQGLIVEHKFPSDFRMETIDQLILQRQAAVTAGAPYHIIEKIDTAILQKQNQDDPDFVQMVRVREEHLPFKGKTEQERIMIINLLPPTDPQRVLWMYYDEIMREAMNRQEGDTPFHRLPFERRAAIISSLVITKTEAIKTLLEQQRASEVNSLMQQYPQNVES